MSYFFDITPLIDDDAAIRRHMLRHASRACFFIVLPAFITPFSFFAMMLIFHCLRCCHCLLFFFAAFRFSLLCVISLPALFRHLMLSCRRHAFFSFAFLSFISFVSSSKFFFLLLSAAAAFHADAYFCARFVFIFACLRCCLCFCFAYAFAAGLIFCC